MNEYSQDVQQGALLLDEKVPGWFNKVNLDRFNCQDPRVCVLAYNFRWYTDGLQALGITPQTNFSHGFSSEVHNPYWIEIIKLRRQWQDYPGPIGYGTTTIGYALNRLREDDINR
jgi:hypothetical protein